MESKKTIAKIAGMYLAIGFVSIGLWKGVMEFYRMPIANPSTVHKLCIKHFLDLEEAKSIKDKELEIKAVNDYWNCHYENIGNPDLND